MKKRPFGEILLDLEKILNEMIDHHQVQFGDILYLVYGWLMIHRPDAREVYIDDSHPVLFYGPEEE